MPGKSKTGSSSSGGSKRVHHSSSSSRTSSDAYQSSNSSGSYNPYQGQYYTAEQPRYPPQPNPNGYRPPPNQGGYSQFQPQLYQQGFGLYSNIILGQMPGGHTYQTQWIYTTPQGRPMLPLVIVIDQIKAALGKDDTAIDGLLCRAELHGLRMSVNEQGRTAAVLLNKALKKWLTDSKSGTFAIEDPNGKEDTSNGMSNLSPLAAALSKLAQAHTETPLVFFGGANKIENKGSESLAVLLMRSLCQQLLTEHNDIKIDELKFDEQNLDRIRSGYLEEMGKLFKKLAKHAAKGTNPVTCVIDGAHHFETSEADFLEFKQVLGNVADTVKTHKLVMKILFTLPARKKYQSWPEGGAATVPGQAIDCPVLFKMGMMKPGSIDKLLKGHCKFKSLGSVPKNDDNILRCEMHPR